MKNLVAAASFAILVFAAPLWLLNSHAESPAGPPTVEWRFAFLTMAITSVLAGSVFGMKIRTARKRLFQSYSRENAQVLSAIGLTFMASSILYLLCKAAWSGRIVVPMRGPTLFFYAVEQPIPFAILYLTACLALCIFVALLVAGLRALGSER